MISERETERIQQICRTIESYSDETLSLETLAKQAGLSPTHFQKRFKAIIGISPRQYQENCRLEKMKTELRGGSDVSTAIYAAGFGSGSRVYEKLDTRLGMTPRQYRNGGKGLTISYGTTSTAFGLLMMAATDRGLCFVQFGETKQHMLEALKAEFPLAEISEMVTEHHSQFDAWMAALKAHLAGERQSIELPLDIQGTAFQMKVWDYLQKIPYGQKRTYTEVAHAIGHPKAVRAVGSACGANNVAIVIPCHRVLRGSGALGGYRWGLEVKHALIDQEQRLSERSP